MHDDALTVLHPSPPPRPQERRTASERLARELGRQLAQARLASDAARRKQAQLSEAQAAAVAEDDETRAAMYEASSLAREMAALEHEATAEAAAAATVAATAAHNALETAEREVARARERKGEADAEAARLGREAAAAAEAVAEARAVAHAAAQLARDARDAADEASAHVL